MDNHEPQHDHHFVLQTTSDPPRAIDMYVPLDQHPELTDADLRSPPGRRVLLPIVLFLATCISTYAAGATDWAPAILFENPAEAGERLLQNWQNGLIYMAAVIGILLTHEMGHFLQTVRYHVPASFPFFIPLPGLGIGTMGAVIAMEGSRGNRKQLFDIGISGPLAGLVVAIPIIIFGIQHAQPLHHVPSFHVRDPWIFKLLTQWLRPELPANVILAKGPLLMAGWVGMLITGLNMMPVSQLDGGHVIYGLFGKRAHWIAKAFVCCAIAAMIAYDSYGWVLMLIVAILIGIEHPPTRDDNVQLGPVRTVIGWLSLAIPVFCFTPQVM
jgi:membrane-associated protease RseP (regulator of RpoE activity)